MDLTRYQGLIFDMDGTLIDTMPAHIEAWRLTAERFDFPFTAEWFHQRGGRPSFKIVDEINDVYQRHYDPAEVSGFKQHAFAALDRHPDRIRHACHLLEQNIGQKKIAVGTGSKREHAIELLKQNYLWDHLDALVSASDVEQHKPHPETFLKACQLIGLEPHQCVVFEDTALGKQAAHAGGMDCYLVNPTGFEFYPVATVIK